MTPYEEQKSAIQKLQADPLPVMPKKTLTDIYFSIERAESLTEVLYQIKVCAKKHQEMCLHCQSIANIITEFER